MFNIFLCLFQMVKIPNLLSLVDGQESQEVIGDHEIPEERCPGHEKREMLKQASLDSEWMPLTHLVWFSVISCSLRILINFLIQTLPYLHIFDLETFGETKLSLIKSYSSEKENIHVLPGSESGLVSDFQYLIAVENT